MTKCWTSDQPWFEVEFLCKSNEELYGESGSNQLVTTKEFYHLCGLLFYTWPLVFYEGDFSPFLLSFLEKNFLFSFLHSRSQKLFVLLVLTFSFPEKIYSHFHKQKCKPMHKSTVDVSSVTFFLSRRRLKMLKFFVCRGRKLFFRRFI
jgi:hypothetical protein